MNDNLTTNIRRRHKWDNPNYKISATCIKCGCRRFAEKFSTGMSWVYIQKGKVVELTAVPACVLHIPEGGDYEALNYQLTMNKLRSTDFHFNTKTPLLGICCYGLPFLQDNALGGLCKTHNKNKWIQN